MKVVLTDEALRDLDEILVLIAANYPSSYAPFQRRLSMILRRIGMWPMSAELVEQRPGVRVVPVIRYPYRIFYQVALGAVEVLHIHHAARREPWEGEG